MLNIWTPQRPGGKLQAVIVCGRKNKANLIVSALEQVWGRRLAAQRLSSAYDLHLLVCPDKGGENQAFRVRTKSNKEQTYTPIRHKSEQ